MVVVVVVEPWRSSSMISWTCLSAVGAVRSFTCLQKMDFEGHQMSFSSLWIHSDLTAVTHVNQDEGEFLPEPSTAAVCMMALSLWEPSGSSVRVPTSTQQFEFLEY